MNQLPGLGPRQRASLLALLALGVFTPILLGTATSQSWLPDWLGAAIAIAALFGTLIVFWRAGAMRLGYLLLFAVALASAAALSCLWR